ncbi:ArgS-related anticodon-binding protein NrtL [Streptomyces sp. NPDC050147]|uniref:ArgS-related anticodon-binding protein NrtL n=1 Tax=Streptomyces sp. NPDC050147 TaxID=3155513 RepID=UPI00343EF33D
MTPVELSRTVLRAMRRAVDDGELSGLDDLSDLGKLSDVGGAGAPWRVVVERPRPGGCGDYATNVALQVARAAGRSPRQVAEVLSPRLASEPGIAAIDITGPGFLNITLDRGSDTSGHAGSSPLAPGSSPVAPGSDTTAPHRGTSGSGTTIPPGGSSGSAALVRDVLERGAHYGHVLPAPAPATSPSPSPTAPRPTGPQESPTPLLTLRFPREPRAAVLADSLRRILRTQGVPVRLTCDEAPDPSWAAAAGLGVCIDAYEKLPADAAAGVQVEILRPRPAPADPTPLGRDAGRWALLWPAGHDLPRVSDEHLVQRASNPLFRVRYAHSRIRALTRNAAALGFAAEPGDITGPEAWGLLDALVDHPRILAAAARHRAPDRLARQLVVVADAFLAFQPDVLPLGDEKPSAAHRARLALAEAAGTVLAGGLSLLGISAPEYL